MRPKSFKDPEALIGVRKIKNGFQRDPGREESRRDSPGRKKQVWERDAVSRRIDLTFAKRKDGMILPAENHGAKVSLDATRCGKVKAKSSGDNHTGRKTASKGTGQVMTGKLEQKKKNASVLMLWHRPNAQKGKVLPEVKEISGFGAGPLGSMEPRKEKKDDRKRGICQKVRAERWEEKLSITL